MYGHATTDTFDLWNGYAAKKRARKADDLRFSNKNDLASRDDAVHF